MKNRTSAFIAASTIGVLCSPASTLACAVCMGAPGSAVNDASNGAIFAMLGFIGTMLGLIVTFFISIARRAKAPLQPHEELSRFVYDQVMEEGRQHA